MAITPNTREEQYLANMSGEDVNIPDPVTRREQYLHKICTSGGGGGATGFKTLDVTVTFESGMSYYTGSITSEIPGDVVVNDVVKVEYMTEGYAPGSFFLQPLPMYTLTPRNTNFEIQEITTYKHMKGDISPEMREQIEQYFPLLLMFEHFRGVSPEGQLTMDFRITYV